MVAGMTESPSLDEALDRALDCLEHGCENDTEFLATWLVDNLVCVLDEFRTESASRCDVAGYEVTRVGEQMIILNRHSEVMNSEQARMLAAALLRAAEAAEQSA